MLTSLYCLITGPGTRCLTRSLSTLALTAIEMDRTKNTPCQCINLGSSFKSVF